jgi:hypothetical protein
MESNLPLHQNHQPNPDPQTAPPDGSCVQDEVDLELLKYVLNHSLSREDACRYLGISENTFAKRCRKANLAFTGSYRGRRLTQKEMLDGFKCSGTPPLREMGQRLLKNMQVTVAVDGDEGLPLLLEHYQLIPRP